MQDLKKPMPIRILSGRKGWVLKVGECCICHSFDKKVYAVIYENGIPFASTEWVSIQALRAFWHKYMPIILYEVEHYPMHSRWGRLELTPLKAGAIITQTAQP